MDPRVRLRYETIDEDDRLWQAGLGDLVRLRACRLTETEPTMLGASGHVIGAAFR
jgi:hypothetical protein